MGQSPEGAALKAELLSFEGALDSGSILISVPKPGG
jgi:hypothetical protein